LYCHSDGKKWKTKLWGGGECRKGGGNKKNGKGGGRRAGVRIEKER